MRDPRIPLLPGYEVALQGDRASLARPQSLTYKKGYAIEGETVFLVKDLPPLPAVVPFPEGKPAAGPTGAAAPTKEPQWVAYDRKVLRWYGFYTEALEPNPVEAWRVHRVTLCYHLADDTLEAAEPKQDNSGLPQGVFIRRAPLQKPDGSPFRPADFQVGGEVVLYGRKVQLTDADAATREHMAAHGLPQGPALPIPVGPYEGWAAARRHHPAERASVSGKPAGQTLQNFLENSRKVLRFHCVWDDRGALYGDRRPYRLHFFLEDGTVEILEPHEPNSGRAPFPVFLQRGPLTKAQDFESVKVGRNVDRALCLGPSDFRLGQSLSVYGRRFFIHDCDAFTRTWLRENLGYSEEELAPIDVAEPLPAPVGHPLPPYNGFGSFEDSAQSCTSLAPRPPRKDLYKLMNRHKIVLRFGARMVGAAAPGARKGLSDVDGLLRACTWGEPPPGRERRFVLSFFMADDTLSVFEPPLKNSGIVGGKFLERRPVYREGSAAPITDADLHVGAVVPICQRAFELHEADEFTLQYMENNRHTYSQADGQGALATVRAACHGNPAALREAIVAEDPQGVGALGLAQLGRALGATGAAISQHQVIAIHRRLPKDEQQRASVEALLQALQ